VLTTLANGLKLATADDNTLPAFGEDCGSVTPSEYLDKFIKPYFKVLKTCTIADGTSCGYPDIFDWRSPDGMAWVCIVLRLALEQPA
jgi:hypothetical protein